MEQVEAIWGLLVLLLFQGSSKTFLLVVVRKYHTFCLDFSNNMFEFGTELHTFEERSTLANNHVFSVDFFSFIKIQNQSV